MYVYNLNTSKILVTKKAINNFIQIKLSLGTGLLGTLPSVS